MESESGEGEGQNAKRRKHAKSSRQASSTGKNNRKHIGNLTEMEFMLQAATRGFSVAKPFGDNEHYDVLVDARPHLWRVQVKSAIDSHARHFQVPSHWMAYKRLIPYTPADIDFLAAFIRRHQIWYLIPIEATRNRLAFNLYPFGIHRRSAGEFEKYREAWHLLESKPSRPRP